MDKHNGSHIFIMKKNYNNNNKRVLNSEDVWFYHTYIINMNINYLIVKIYLITWQM